MNDVSEWYDRRMFRPALKRADNGDFSNYGYWRDTTATHREACENLMAQLLSLNPKKGTNILDVACGKGASTRYLLQTYSDVTAINISPAQLERCREVAPDGKFLVMDATSLQFEADSFDDMICVEAAFHFETRATFLAEAFRVLRPGGHLVMSDILHCEWSRPSFFPKANYVPSVAQYIDVFKAAGFGDVVIEDATEPSLLRFCKHRIEHLNAALKEGRIDAEAFRKGKDALFRKMLKIRQYLLVCARKPG